MIRLGEIIRLRSFKDYGPDGASWAEFKADNEKNKKKQKVFVCAIIGIEDKCLTEDSEVVDIEKAFNEMGWIKDPEKWEKKDD